MHSLGATQSDSAVIVLYTAAPFHLGSLALFPGSFPPLPPERTESTQQPSEEDAGK